MGGSRNAFQLEVKVGPNNFVYSCIFAHDVAEII